MFGRERLWPVVGQLIILAERDSAAALIMGWEQPIDMGQLEHGQKEKKKDGSVKPGHLLDFMLFT